MYFLDLSVYTYGRALPDPNIVNVGWLSSGHPFPVGQPASEFLEALRQLVSRPVNLFRGLHKCEFCPDSPPLERGGFLWNTNPPEVLGNGEIRVVSGCITYVAPVLIRHYVEVHQYKPPQAFVEACLGATADRELLGGRSTSPLAVQLPDHTASIAVSPTAYLRLSEFERLGFDEWADGWSYEATIDARVETFSCDHYRLGFHDLSEFVCDLRKAFDALRGVVSLRKKSRMPAGVRETESLTFRFIENTGHVLLSGDLGRGAALGASLKFQLAFDQTYLGPFLDDLEKINIAVHG